MGEQKEVVADVRALLSSIAAGGSIEISDDTKRALGEVLSERFKTALTGRTPVARTEARTLHFSEIGHPCRRNLWYRVHRPDLAEEMPESAIMKFLYGDLIEELYLALVRLSGHEVSDEQKRCEIDLPGDWKITGYLDARIDGTVVDVKSASTPSFKKFENGLPEDPFGYHAQLRGYVEAEGETRGAWHVVDKTLGHVTYLEREFSPMEDWEKVEIVDAVDREEPPPRAFEAIPEGKSGNLKLPVTCSYCPYKKACWPGVRTFLYSSRPVFLVKVEKEPKVPEYTGG